MNSKLYYIKIRCKKKAIFPNVTYYNGELLYYNNKVSSNETYILNINVDNYNKELLRKIPCSSYHLPFTRKKDFATKFKSLKRAEYITSIINMSEYFCAEIKTIKIFYNEE